MINGSRPSLAQKGWNFTKAVGNHIADGFKHVTTEELQARLKICDTCEMRDGDRCNSMNCGCILSIKAKWKSERCPLHKWNVPIEITPLKGENNDK